MPNEALMDDSVAQFTPSERDFVAKTTERVNYTILDAKVQAGATGTRVDAHLISQFSAVVDLLPSFGLIPKATAGSIRLIQPS